MSELTIWSFFDAIGTFKNRLYLLISVITILSVTYVGGCVDSKTR